MNKIKKIILTLLCMCAIFLLMIFILFFSFNAYDKYKISKQAETYYGYVDEDMRAKMTPDAEYLEVKNLKKIDKNDDYESQSKYLEDLTRDIIISAHNSNGEINDEIAEYYINKEIFFRLDHFYKYIDSVEMVPIHADKKAFIACGYDQKERIYYEKINNKWKITDCYIHI